MKLRYILLLTVFAVAFVSGCGPRVVMVPEGEPVMLAEDVKAFVYVEVDGKTKRSRNRVTLHEGWYAAPVGDD